MNPLVSFSSTGVLFSAFIAILSLRLSKAPGWAHLRYLAWVALACVGVSAARTGEYLLAASPLVVVALRCELASLGAGILAWLAYSRAHLGLRASRAERAYAACLGAASVATLIPGFAFGSEVARRTLPPGLSFVDPVLTPFAEALYAAWAAGAAFLLVRYARAWRRGAPAARSHLLGALLGVGPCIWDATVTMTGAQLPYVTDPGLFLSLAIVPLALAESFRADVVTRRNDRTDLETLVTQRTSALTIRRHDLARSEQLASLGRLAAGVSHEVNSPVAAALANVDWLLDGSSDGEPPEEILAAVDEATRAVDRVRRIVRQLAHLTGAPTTPARTQRVELAPALAQAVRLAEAMRGRAVEIRAEACTPGLAASGDEGVIVQIAVNLLANAVDAIDEARTDGRVTIRASREGDRTAVTVEDNGSGMSAETLARVFEPFFTTKAVGRGTGLGLAVSRGLAATLGGSLRVDSRLGEGTRVTIDLAVASEPSGDAIAPPSGPRVPSRRRRVLLVDDERAVRAALQRLLSRYHHVETAGGVDEALTALAREPYDLVLCDVVMPDGGGERVYRAVAARDPEQARRIVFVTGGAPDEATRRFLAAQPQPVLDKPVDLATLEAVARTIAG